MDFLILAILIAIGSYALTSRDQRQRIATLGSHLSQYQIEKLMETVTQGYLRALGEKDAARQEQIWALLNTSEAQLAEQFKRFASEFAKAAAEQTRVSKIAIALPYADTLFPGATFDLRKAFAIHAQGIARAADAATTTPAKDKAFTMSAELFLMQHTCHWFCKSKTVASARMMARHQTTYAQLVAAVSPETRRAYCSLVEA
ncbi:hypothetical protein [Rhodoferax sp. WC2427]|uniref:hypothetical protein n=1 Tax=Rhodoferax sp. WC2427 TaxID=3234144 RepID=UPI003466FC91